MQECDRGGSEQLRPGSEEYTSKSVSLDMRKTYTVRVSKRAALGHNKVDCLAVTTKRTLPRELALKVPDGGMSSQQTRKAQRQTSNSQWRVHMLAGAYAIGRL